MPAVARSRLSGFALACLLACGAASAAAEWRFAALYGGEVRSLAFDPREPAQVLAGTAGGGIFRSSDGGESWQPAGPNSPLSGWVIGALHFDPHRPGRLWAALWGIWGGGQVARSDDRGATWQLRGQALAAEQVYALALPMGRPGTLYAGTRGGVYRSDDDGATWRSLSRGVAGLVHVSSLLVDPERPDAVLAGTWRRAYRSDDGGATWRGVFAGMVEDTELFSLHAVAGRSGEVWASTCGWVYRGDGFGERWQRFRQGLAERRTPALAVLPGGRLLAGTVAGVYRSDDGGANWALASDRALSLLSFAVDPRDARRVLAGSEGAGVWLSTDGGASWAPRLVGLTNVRVPAIAASGDGLAVAVKHAGPLAGLYRSPDGLSFPPRPQATLPTVTALAATAHGLLAATEAGLFEQSGGEWRWVAELGERRIEQIAVSPGRAVARTREGLWERSVKSFTPLAWKHGRPTAVALADDGLWASDAAGLYRLRRRENHAVAAPARVGSLLAAGGTLLLAGEGRVWTRDGLAGAWQERARSVRRQIATGDPRFPAVLAGDEEAWLMSASGERRALGLPLAAREILAAAIFGGRLYVGTAGRGLLIRELSALGL